MTDGTIYNGYKMVSILVCLYEERLEKSPCIGIYQVVRMNKEIIKSNTIVKIDVEINVKSVKTK